MPFPCIEYQVMGKLLSSPPLGLLFSKEAATYSFLMGCLAPFHMLVSHLGRCVLVSIYLKVCWMGLRIGLWGWLAWPLQSKTAPNLSVTPSLLWSDFFRYRTYIPYRYYSRELKAYVQTKTCARMFTAALFTMALKWKQTTQMFLNEQIAKQNMFYQYNGIIVFGHKDE